MERKVQKAGDRGKAILLPAIWTTLMKIKIGDKLKVTIMSDGSLLLSK